MKLTDEVDPFVDISEKCENEMFDLIKDLILEKKNEIKQEEVKDLKSLEQNSK